ncbi:methionine--tRNA ligase [Candidatus Kaiserbacteria bacterium RIFCSPHIGHO2_02_FULL_50_50]|uniref:Methionine--tRNA ligase n=1 Tax=Candidatus Kaiserbacteria bacterium RIFCSPHIGHO2_02_FULL_50_50 TaxID=1798492 RepID=A0A1F6DDE4_9BACT|nr:MAG: methionine--tRNA ligase [Candidatus Kaiserbacteria bacterium RIFCSPHIGHO2_02_FULL_50_50]OGG89128.1 MAG: methionine--tRNA ligase [Candidatus Kaiserbacteria bacterium RIFCSPLOWO2_12_FULL_50_10]
MKNIYITTTLPYVNADPHIGFGLEIIRADALARAHRLSGDSVFFTTGTDEHGQKIAEKADAEGKGRQEYVDYFAGQFAKLRDALDLSYDNFIRTTSPAHKAAAQEMWKRCAANGDIYKKKYTGLYCVGDEMFLKDSDLVNGRCPNHPNMDPQEVEEENYFFALSKYQNYLEEYLAKPGVIEPEFRRLEALNFVKAGLEDFSISREVSRMDWGIPVPGDDTQVMYVWFDALTNYISTLGWPEEGGNFKKFWIDGETLQLAGKDQVRFQSIMWQAMLKSAGLPATDHVDYHGFINSGGQKMSKSLGNVIAPFDLVEKYGTDATRYMLLRHVHPYDDTDITWERMDEWYTANLVNGLGNLASRIMKMAETHGVAPALPQVSLEANDFLDLEKVWHTISMLDEKIATEEPFKVIKVDAEKGKAIIAELVIALHKVALSLQAATPKTAAAILSAINTNTKPENLFPRLPA